MGVRARRFCTEALLLAPRTVWSDQSVTSVGQASVLDGGGAVHLVIEGQLLL